MKEDSYFLGIPAAYFLTFTCYGARPHGSAKLSVDRNTNVFNDSMILPNKERYDKVINLMKEDPYVLDQKRRRIVLQSLKSTCIYHQWDLFAAHIRTNHVHLVLSSSKQPELVSNLIKSYASRYLNQAGIDKDRVRRWTRHGSTRYLWHQNAIEAAIHYVLHEQGEPMEVFDAKNDSLREAEGV